jgi:hypothetical protein
LVARVFAALAADPKLSHAEALRKSNAGDDPHPEQAEPYWAQFMVVGEPPSRKLSTDKFVDCCARSGRLLAQAVWKGGHCCCDVGFAITERFSAQNWLSDRPIRCQGGFRH